jgi:hypothetical protein
MAENPGIKYLKKLKEQKLFKESYSLWMIYYKSQTKTPF